MSMRLVNGYACRNCADEELAKKGIDPAQPRQALAGSEAYVSDTEAARNRGALSPLEANSQLGVNRPERSGDHGRLINLFA